MNEECGIEMRTATLVVLLTFLTLSITVAYAESEPVVEWDRTYGGQGIDTGCSVQVTNGGDYIISGWTNSYGAGDYDVLLIKADPDGNKLWNKTFGGQKEDFGSSVQETSDGGYIIVGSTESFGAGNKDMWLIKTNSEGYEEWNKTFGRQKEDFGSSVQETSDGGYIIVGSTESFGAGNKDMWLIKTDSEGYEEWNRTFGSSNDDIAWQLDKCDDDGYVIIGWTDSYDVEGRDILLIKTDSDGNEEWNQTFGSSNDDIGMAVRQTRDEGFIITGERNSHTDINTGRKASDLWLIKTNPDGIEEWNSTVKCGESAVGISVQEAKDGGYVVAGQGFDSAAIVKTNSNGLKLWGLTFDDTHYFKFRGSPPTIESIQEIDFGEYILTGRFSYRLGNPDVLLIKIKEMVVNKPNV